MAIGSKRESMILFLGDIVSFAVAAWLALALRQQALPSLEMVQFHIVPLALLSFLWVITFFVIGLYDRPVLVSEKKTLSVILNAQIINSVIAVIFFYLFTPYLGITPKTILVLVISISTILIIVWRLLEPTIVVRGVHTEPTLLIGSGEELQELKDEVNARAHYTIRFVSVIDLDRTDGIDVSKEIESIVARKQISSIVVYLHHEKARHILPTLYKLIFSGVQFYDMNKVYEEVFGRIPLSIVHHGWFLENISSSAHVGYDVLKRGMDIIIALLLGTISLVLYPLIILAIKIEDGGPVFIIQDRVGQGNRVIRMRKFRSMDRGDYATWITEGDRRITQVGHFLRKSRLDELPQLWSVIRGDISLIGPRPDIVEFNKKLVQELPYYTMRNLIKPGLSGWAQIKQDTAPQSIKETRERLAYDLYYVKNRSFVLDLAIALKTIRTLVSRTGR